MAEIIGVVSGVITFADVTWKSCKNLHDLIQDIKETPSELLYLRSDLEEVGRILNNFADMNREAGAHENVQYRVALKQCLERLRPCIEELGNTCDQFSASLNEVFRHSTPERISNRDRFSFHFQEGNIRRFRNRLGSYKNTLTVALGLASLAATSSTTRDIGNLEVLIKDTNSNIAVQLRDVEAGLNTLAAPSQSSQSMNTNDEVAATRDAELTALRSQKQVLEDCLKVCSSASQGVRVKHAEAFDDSRHFIGNVGEVKAGGPPVEVEKLIARDRARQVAGNIDGASALAFLNG